jgi:hypothetical protein
LVFCRWIEVGLEKGLEGFPENIQMEWQILCNLFAEVLLRMLMFFAHAAAVSTVKNGL